MKRPVDSVPNLLKDYQPDPAATQSARVADLLTYVAKELPGSFIARRYVARVAFALARNPADGSDYCGKKLTAVIACAKHLLERRSGDWVVADKFLGIRMTFSDDDRQEHAQEGARRRIGSSIRKMGKVSATIDKNNLSPDHRRRFNTIVRYHGLLDEYDAKVPLLTAGDPNKKPEGEGNT